MDKAQDGKALVHMEAMLSSMTAKERARPDVINAKRKIRIAKGARKRGPFSTIDEAVAAIQAGRMLIVVDDEDRENEGDLTMAASKVTPEAINFMVKYGRGLVCLSMTPERLLELLEPAVATGLVVEAPDSWSSRFSHALLPEALYGSLTRLARARIHRRVGEALDAGEAERQRARRELLDP